ncbi:MAG: DUF4080 domain-containing protein [Betaproteobacteria bacterium]|nr:DUF4080 domain-containing protein [Betaproteobacteria bacterium]
MLIVLATINARYAHASLGLRCLLANLGELRQQTCIAEFSPAADTAEIVERLLAHAPRIVGFGVYIWNVAETTWVVEMLKRVAPEVRIVLGGPEVSFETAEQAIVQHADHVITGWGEVTLPQLCRQLLDADRQAPPPRIQAGVQVSLETLELPYALYADADIAHRTLYVEASRGCPFKCEFCLSALDKTAWPFNLDTFLGELEKLHARGARRFKFVDRTFNLQIGTSIRILRFLLDKHAANPDDPVFAHFEVVPDYLPEALKEIIARFPSGTLQFEIGIQTWNPEVQNLISRKQDNAKAAGNLHWLRQNSQVHLHADLIFGLPGEDLASFGRGFDRLVALAPHEIQVGMLKRLRGAPIIRHSAGYGLVFDPAPPYQILATNCIDFQTMQRMRRFARYWELVANSGRFANTLPVLLGTQPFASFLAFSDWLYASTNSTHHIALDRLAGLVGEWLQSRGVPEDRIKSLLTSDYAGQPSRTRSVVGANPSLPQRQAQHLA